MRALAGTLAVLAAPILAACDTHPLDATLAAPTAASPPSPTSAPSATSVMSAPDAMSPATVFNALTESLLAYYPFDEDGGVVVHDSSGQMRNGALTGGTWLLDGGKFGGALHLNAGDFVTVNDFPDAPLSFSVSVWVRTAAAPMGGYGTLLSTELLYDGGWQFNLEGNDAGIATHFAYWDNTINGYTLARCACVVPNEWMHLVSVVDSANASHTLVLYVNGAVSANKTGVQSILPGAPALSIGTWSGGQRFLVGDIDDVAIYDRALSQTEVRELGQHPPIEPP